MKRIFCTLVMLLALATAPAFGQGCVMCYTSAKGASPRAQQALRRAIYVLLLPAISLMGGIALLGYHYSRQRDEEKQ